MKLKRIISFGLAAVLSCGLLAGCGNLSNDEDTIKIMLSGTKPTGWDRVLEKYEETGAKETKVHIDVEWVSQGDYKEKLNLRMIGSENYDIVFDAPFNKLKNFAAYEMYVPLEEYIENGKYPNLNKGISEGNCRCKPLFRTSLRIAYDENIRKWYRLCILQKRFSQKIQYRFGRTDKFL